MNSSSPAKTLSWSLIQPYLTFLKTHDTQIAKLISLKDEGVLALHIVEDTITNAMIQMHDFVVKILSDNKII
jgi:hypothetical protein